MMTTKRTLATTMFVGFGLNTQIINRDIYLALHQRGHALVTLSGSSGEMDWDPNIAPKLDFNECFYSILEAEPTADAKTLKKAYYKMVFKYHPDNKETVEEKALCNKQMMVINGAYSILKDPQARELYNAQRRRGLLGENAGIKPGAAAPSTTKQPSPKSSERARKEKASSGSSFGGAWKTTGDERDGSFADSFRWKEDFFSEVSGEEWFDEELKEKLRAAQRWERRSGRTSSSSSVNRSIFDEIAELLKQEEQRSRKRLDERENYSTNNDRYVDYDSYSKSEFSSELVNMQNNVMALRRELERKESNLKNDATDWGEVRDYLQVEKRLRAIAECKELRERLISMQNQLMELEQQLRGADGGRRSVYQEDIESRPYRRSSSPFEDRIRTAQASSRTGRRPQTSTTRDLWEVPSPSIAPQRSRDDFFEVNEEVDAKDDAQTWRRAYERRRGKSGDDFVNDEIRKLRNLP